MIIAITGGTGFIGNKLANKHIEMGHKVRILSRKPIKNTKIQYYLGDLVSSKSDLNSFLKDVDILYHCAGEVNNKSLMQDLHVNGTKRLVNAARGLVGCWVQLSSVGAYGVFRNGEIDEKTVEKPFGIYEKTKAESDKIVRDCCIPSVIVRPSIVFGNEMKNSSLKELLVKVQKGLFFFIGKPGSKVNYVHVNDLVEFLMLCGTNYKALGHTFIISQNTSIEKMINSFQSRTKNKKNFIYFPENPLRVIVKVIEFLNFPFPLTLSRIDALTNKCTYNSSKAQEMLGFTFSIPLEEGFKLFK